MSPPITRFVNVSAVVSGAAPSVFGFGSICGVFTHSVNTNRLSGPYNSLKEMTAAGFTSSAVPEIYYWGNTVFNQRLGGRPVYVGRRVGGDSSWTATLDAVEAVDEDAFYRFNIESRVTADILLAAAWAQSRNNDSLKRYVAQSNDASFLNGTGAVRTATFGGTPTDGLYRLAFSGFGLGSPVNVDVTRATTPATNSDLATAMAAAITALIATTLSTVVASAVANGADVVITFANGLATGTLTPTAPAPGTLTVVLTDADVATQLAALAYDRTTLLYHADDSGANGYLDGMATSIVSGFKVDQPGGAGAMAWKGNVGGGVTFDALTPPQATAIENAGGNYFGRKRGAQWIWPGQTCAGAPYYDDIPTTVDWFTRRTQEAYIARMVGVPTRVGYNQEGIELIAGDVQKVLDRGVQCGHFLGDPGFEPHVEGPELRLVPQGDRFVRKLALTSKANRATFLGAIQELELVVYLDF